MPTIHARTTVCICGQTFSKCTLFLKEQHFMWPRGSSSLMLEKTTIDSTLYKFNCFPEKDMQWPAWLFTILSFSPSCEVTFGQHWIEEPSCARNWERRNQLWNVKTGFSLEWVPSQIFVHLWCYFWKWDTTGFEIKSDRVKISPRGPFEKPDQAIVRWKRLDWTPGTGF